MLHRSRRISGAISVALVVLVAPAACISTYSLKSGGLDPSLKTVAVLPFENRTTSPGLERELAEMISTEMRKMGRKEAPEATAHIVVSGVITRYDLDIPVAFSADPSRAAGTRRRLEIGVDVRINNTVAGTILFQRPGMVGPGEYAESAELTGRREALVKIVNEIVRGIQSQW